MPCEPVPGGIICSRGRKPPSKEDLAAIRAAIAEIESRGKPVAQPAQQTRPIRTPHIQLMIQTAADIADEVDMQDPDPELLAKMEWAEAQLLHAAAELRVERLQGEYGYEPV